jgi:hypothetical protein
MGIRRLFAILILAIPIVAFAWIVRSSAFADAKVGVDAPRYISTTAPELAKLDREVLAKALATAMQKSNEMNVQWQSAKAEYDQLRYVLLGVVAMLSIALAYPTWRMPFSRIVEGGMQKSAEN